MARIIKANGQVFEVLPKNGKDFNLEEMQSIVGGYIELIYLNRGIMVVNEEGKLLSLPVNKKATEIAHQTIVGDVLLCAKNQIK